MKTILDEFLDGLQKGRCLRCPHSKPVVANEQWMFLGCYHEPYHGKCVAEIKDCPKQTEEVKGIEI